MRRKERQVNLPEEILEIIAGCQDCAVGMIDQEGLPYVVPLNFGFERIGETFVFYFHSALTGKKIDCIKAQPNICLTFVSHQQVVSRDANVACTYTTKYQSVIASGTAEVVTDMEEKRKGLQLLMKKQTGRDDFTYQEEMIRKVAVIKVICSEVSGKSSLS